MTDCPLPIAKRTRLREAQVYKEVYEKLKRKKMEIEADSVTQCGLAEVSEKGRGNEGKKLGFDFCLDGESLKVKEQNVGNFEVIGERCREKVDFEVLEGLGANNAGNPTMGFQNMDDDDDNYMVFMGEENGAVDVDVVELSSSTEELGVGDEKDEEAFDGLNIAGEKSGGLENSSVKSVNLSFDPSKSCGVAKRTRSCLRSLQKSQGVGSRGDVSVVHLDESETSSSNDDKDDDEAENEDYQVKKSQNSFSLQSSCLFNRAEEEEAMERLGDSEVKNGSDDREKGSTDETGLEKEANEFEILIDLDDDENENINEGIDDSGNVSRGFDCVARRTRSHFISELGKKKRELGTLSCSLSVDEEDSDSLPEPSASDDETDEPEDSDTDKESDDSNFSGDGTYNSGSKTGTTSRKADSRGRNYGECLDLEKICRKDEECFGDPTARNCVDSRGGNGGECLEKICRKDEGYLGKPRERKRGRVLKDRDVVKILAGSILDKGDDPLTECISYGNVHYGEDIDMSITLPLKFKFGVQEQSLPEKSDYEKELDGLWAEMEFALRSCEIGFTESPTVENKDVVSLEVEPGAMNICLQGVHQLILDEQIGIICKLCSFVKLEIRYIVPEFSPNYWEKLGRIDYDAAKHSILDEIRRHDVNGGSEFGCHPAANSSGTVWDIIPGVKDGMYPHQCEGFEFIWKNIAGGVLLDELKSQRKSSGGAGCIISHAPGTGKSRLTIVFLQTYLELYPTCRPVIVAPCSMLLTWEEEFRKWKVNIPFHNLNTPEFSGEENRLAVSLLSQIKYGARSVHSMRMVKLYSWKKDRSVLGISYRLFETLTGKDKKRKAQRTSEEEQVREILLDLPGLFIFDEGHTPRNGQSDMWKALSKIKTERRIILSGTPFQNNFSELYNTLCLARPKFIDIVLSSTTHIEITTRRGRKRDEAKEKWASLTSSIGKLDDDRLEHEKLNMVKVMISPFVHVHKGTILQQSLPGLKHSLVVLKPQHLQKSLLECLLGTRNIIHLNLSVSLVSVHPWLFSECSFEKDKLDVDEDELKTLRLKPEAGIKTKFLMEFLRLCEAVDEKVIVFGQYREPLNLIRDQLKFLFKWTEGKEVLYMDGNREIKQRQCSINTFNDPKSEARVLLASTRACCEGINLVGGSRVVLLDVAWNPSLERQAISRAYRLGQKKAVHVYHLITSGTMEEEKSLRQAGKDRASELVFSSLKGCCIQQKVSSDVSEDKILEAMVQHDELKCMFKDVILRSEESSLIDTFDLVDV